MTIEQQTRREILLQLYSIRPLGSTAVAIARRAERGGLEVSAAAVGREVAYLVGLGLLARQLDPSTGMVHYTITSAGILDHETGADSAAPQ